MRSFSMYLTILSVGLVCWLGMPQHAQAQKKTPTSSQEAQQQRPAAPAIQPPATGEAPQLLSFQLENRRGARISTTAGTVYLRWEMKGSKLMQHHYRVSHIAGFSGAPWLVVPAKGRPTYTFPASTPQGPQTIYLQLMNDAGRSEVATAQIDYRLPLPDLDPSVTQAPNPVYPGQTLTYTVTVHNAGLGTAEGIYLYNELPEGLEFEAVQEATHGFWCDYQAQLSRLRCLNGDLEPGQTARLEIETSVPETAQPGHQLVFGVEADPENQMEEENENNNAAGAVANTTEAPLVDHVIPGYEAVAFARQHGFSFFTEDLQPPSGCTLRLTNVEFTMHVPNTPIPTPEPVLSVGRVLAETVAPDVYADQVRCRYVFFALDKLKAPWTLKDVKMMFKVYEEGKSFEKTWVTPPQYGTDDPRFALEMSNGDGVYYVWGHLDTITLTAPQNHDDWRDAFRD